MLFFLIGIRILLVVSRRHQGADRLGLSVLCLAILETVSAAFRHADLDGAAPILVCFSRADILRLSKQRSLPLSMTPRLCFQLGLGEWTVFQWARLVGLGGDLLVYHVFLSGSSRER